jgi:hypothetical protein
LDSISHGGKVPEKNSEKNRRERIAHVFIKNPTWPTSSVAKSADAPLSTTKDVIKRLLVSGSVEKKPGSCRKVGSGDLIREKKIIASLKRNPQLSLQDLVCKYGTVHGNVIKITPK